MALKNFGFKRIAKEPLKPVEPAPRETIAGVPIPTQDELAKMSAEEAYKKGEELGNAVNAILKNAKPVRTVTTAAVIPPQKNVAGYTSVTTLFKKSTTGIGHKQWSIWQEPNTVIVEWGHCDKTKQQKRYSFLNKPHLAASWVADAIRKKLKEGYKSSK